MIRPPALRDKRSTEDAGVAGNDASAHARPFGEGPPGRCMMTWMRSGPAAGGEKRPGETGADGTSDDASRASATGGLAEAALLLLAAALPFEAPLFRAGPLQITTVELVLYAMLAAWGIGVGLELRGGRLAWRASLDALRRDRMAWAAVLWVVVAFGSASAAPSDRTAAFKFALRTLSGVLAFFAVRSLVRTRRLGARVIVALVAGAIASAVTAVIDGLVSESASAWRPFHAGTFDAFGLKRASGVFEYPTIGAMYWEAAMPLLIVAPFAWRASQTPRAPAAAARTRAAFAVALASAVLFLAILESATRTALVGAGVACAMLVVLGRPHGPPLPRAAAVSLLVLVGLTVVALRPGADSLLGQRLRFWHDDRWFGAEYDVPSDRWTVDGGEVFAVPITLHNTGSIAWRAGGALPTRLSYHWAIESPGAGPPHFVEYDGRRTDLPGDVRPGGTVRVTGIVRAPESAGAYRLSWDLVQEDVTWFSDRGIATGDQSIDVQSAGSTPPREVLVPMMSPPAIPRSSLWRVAVVLWRQRPLLGIGPDNFRRRYEALLPPSPNGVPYVDTRIHANSLYFETLADLGLVGLTALAAIAIALLRSLRRHWEAGCVAGLGAAVAALTFFVHGLLDYFFEFTPLVGLFWVTLGLTAAFERELPGSPARPRSPR